MVIIQGELSGELSQRNTQEINDLMSSVSSQIHESRIHKDEENTQYTMHLKDFYNWDCSRCL